MNQKDDVIDLGVLFWNFLRSLRSFWWFVPIFTLVAMVGGVGYSVLTFHPMYRSSASFTVLTGESYSNSASTSYGFYYDSRTAGQLAKSFPYVLSSNLLTDAIKTDLQVEEVNASLSALAVQDSNLITMTAVSDSAEDAQKILESAIRVYPEAARFVLGSLRFNMIELPTLPERPYNEIGYVRCAARYGMVGAFLAFALIFLIAFLRKTIQKPDELQDTVNLENLGNIPEIRRKARGKEMKEISILDKNIYSGFKENMASLFVRIEREMAQKENCKVLLVSSTQPGEGKTMFALNLAFTGAKMGKRIFYIDADFRKQEVYQKLTGQKGLNIMDYATGKCKLDELMYKDPKLGIYLLRAGVPQESPEKLLNKKWLEQMLEAFKPHMDMIILDVPPCGMFEDATVLAKCADAAVCVLRHDYVEKRHFVRTISELEETDCAMLGYIFNFVPVHRSRSGNYGYGYGRYGYGYYGYGSYGYGSYGEDGKKHKERKGEA